MEENKVVAKPAKTAKVAKVANIAKAEKLENYNLLINRDYGQGFFMAGALGIFLYGLSHIGLFEESPAVTNLLANQPLIASLMLLLVGLFSIKKVK